MWFRKPKKPNPKIKELEKNLDERGLLLVDAQLNESSILIWDGNEFAKFAKRSSVRTIFKEEGRYQTNYFYTVDGEIIRTFLVNEVRETK